jgi:hypothetical protein
MRWSLGDAFNIGHNLFFNSSLQNGFNDHVGIAKVAFHDVLSSVRASRDSHFIGLVHCHALARTFFFQLSPM